MKSSGNARSIVPGIHNDKVLAMHSLFNYSLVRAVVFNSCVLCADYIKGAVYNKCVMMNIQVVKWICFCVCL